jgi:hypothetical protein
MIQARYRADYPGEFIILETKWSGGKKEQTREWIVNPIENHHISGRAAVIGSNIDKDRFDYTKLQRHRGGLLSSKKLQTYGIGAIASEMRLDFTVETNATRLATLLENQYHETNVVYTTTRNCINNPEKCYLIPLNPNLMDIALPIYLAAFDGHKEIFLLGYTKDHYIENAEWVTHVSMIVESYPTVKFYFVGEKTNLFPEWVEHASVTTLTYQDFISYCDI